MSTVIPQMAAITDHMLGSRNLNRATDHEKNTVYIAMNIPVDSRVKKKIEQCQLSGELGRCYMSLVC
jgi:hypothetical protein